MFLRNFDNYMIAVMGANILEDITTSLTANITTPFSCTQTSYNSGSEFADGRINQRTTAGSFSKVYVDQGNQYVHSPAPACAQAICLGDGNTPVTYNDYKLSGTVLNPSFSLVKQSVVTSFSDDYKKIYKDLTIIIVNTSSSEQTIKEWGIWRVSNNATSLGWLNYDNNSSNRVLSFREVLGTPVTVGASGSAQLTLRIEYPIPNHP